MNRRLLSSIAHEAHRMGRIYNQMGEPILPSKVYEEIEKMINNKIKEFAKEDKEATND